MKYLALILLALTACAKSEVTVYQNVETGELVECVVPKECKHGKCEVEK